MTEKEWKDKLKSNHICVNCKQTDAYTMAGRRLCAECAGRAAERVLKKRNTDEAYRLQAVQRTKEWRKRKAEEHCCPRCGKPLPNGYEKKLCVECLAYSRKRNEGIRREKGARTWEMRNEDGTCYICGETAIEGKRMCKSCYESRLPSMMKNLEKAWENNAWRTAKA